ncbi:MAG: hypothetical protein AB1510_11335 [Bacillota bacterium]
MVYLFLLLLFYAVVAYFEVPRMLKNNMSRELYAFIVISVLGFVLAAGQIMHFPLPNITKGIETVIKPVHKGLEALLLPPDFPK